jgi:hypothetical protein
LSTNLHLLTDQGTKNPKGFHLTTNPGGFAPGWVPPILFPGQKKGRAPNGPAVSSQLVRLRSGFFYQIQIWSGRIVIRCRLSRSSALLLILEHRSRDHNPDGDRGFRTDDFVQGCPRGLHCHPRSSLPLLYSPRCFSLICRLAYTAFPGRDASYRIRMRNHRGKGADW